MATNYSTQPANPQGNGEKRPHGNNRGLKQAYDFRDIAANEAKSLMECVCTTLEDKVTRARALKDCNSVWYAASERIRIIKGKPMPGSLRPIAKPKKVRTISTAPLEQLPIEQAREPGRPDSICPT